ncbi:hypothetical protein CEE69_14375 [Rhodopirellula bahusiensis]|uniref:Uncharacterized protein n=1 Tax=Rhodopirellula bahusiensis TaxID=2014065 RepID=A0A2G1W6E3_9BACT|nr:hypothetical protein CEE69_14375 [Rhodopirellula bahusiensis]
MPNHRRFSRQNQFVVPQSEAETGRATPSPNQPGTLGQQLAAISVSLYLAERRGLTAAEVWDDARRLVIPHASGGLCK